MKVALAVLLLAFSIFAPLPASAVGQRNPELCSPHDADCACRNSCVEAFDECINARCGAPVNCSGNPSFCTFSHCSPANAQICFSLKATCDNRCGLWASTCQPDPEHPTAHLAAVGRSADQNETRNDCNVAR
jgi:hypothetical protein